MGNSKTRTMKVMCPNKSDADKLAVDQIGLYSHLYSELFGAKFGKEQQSKPWLRGIVVVERLHAKGDFRRMRLLFSSGSLTGVGKDACLMGPIGRAQLGIRSEGEEVQVRVEHQWLSRALFNRNHPLDGYIDGIYNSTRRHQHLGRVSPDEFEAAAKHA